MDNLPSTVRIQVASDIHLEFHDGALLYVDAIVAPTGASVLALVGDIGSPTKSSYDAFLSAVAARYEHVLVVPGNHEYYGGSAPDAPSMADLASTMRKKCALYPNVHLLDDDAVVLDGVRYVGSTLWSFIPNVFRNRCTKDINDYHLIRTAAPSLTVCNEDDSDVVRRHPVARFAPVDCHYDGDEIACRTSTPPTEGLLTVTDTNALHATSVDFIQEQIAEAARSAPRQPVVVLTHHAPSFRSIHRRYATSRLVCAFATNLERLMKSPVVLWLHGHTHTASDYEVVSGGCDINNQGGDSDNGGGGDDAGRGHIVRVVNNPMGYRDERDESGYVKDKVVEILVPA
jgi:hypothetical protein